MQDGNEIFFKIKRTTPLKKLMQAYCERQSVDMNSIAFLWDGARIRAEQTPDEVSCTKFYWIGFPGIFMEAVALTRMLFV